MDSIKPPWISVDSIVGGHRGRFCRSQASTRVGNPWRMWRGLKHLKFPSCSHLEMLFLRMGVFGVPKYCNLDAQMVNTVNTPFAGSGWLWEVCPTDREKTVQVSSVRKTPATPLADSASASSRWGFLKIGLPLNLEFPTKSEQYGVPHFGNPKQHTLSWLDWLDNHFSHD